MKTRTIKLQQKSNTINFFVLGLMALVSVFMFTSCDDDDDDEYYTGELWVERATVVSDGNDLILQTDGNRTITITTNHAGNYTPTKNQRAIVRYTLEDKDKETGAYNATLYNINDILTKSIVDLTSENEAEMGNDPIHLYHVWCAGGYLNVNFGFNYGGTTSHMINLVNNTTIKYGADGKVHLEFRHNAYDDPQNEARLGTVSFDLESYKKEDGEPVTFVIKFDEFGSESYHEIVYDFKNNNSSPEGEGEDYVGDWGYF